MYVPTFCTDSSTIVTTTTLLLVECRWYTTCDTSREGSGGTDGILELCDVNGNKMFTSLTPFLYSSCFSVSRFHLFNPNF